jgi:hypothetical protein
MVKVQVVFLILLSLLPRIGWFGGVRFLSRGEIPSAIFHPGRREVEVGKSGGSSMQGIGVSWGYCHRHGEELSTGIAPGVKSGINHRFVESRSSWFFALLRTSLFRRFEYCSNSSAGLLGADRFQERLK